MGGVIQISLEGHKNDNFGDNQFKNRFTSLILRILRPNNSWYSVFCTITPKFTMDEKFIHLFSIHPCCAGHFLEEEFAPLQFGSTMGKYLSFNTGVVPSKETCPASLNFISTFWLNDFAPLPSPMIIHPSKSLYSGITVDIQILKHKIVRERQHKS